MALLLLFIGSAAATPATSVCSSNLTVECTNSAGMAVNFVSGPSGPAVLCIPPTGSTFPIGTTTVNCVAWDTYGNSNSCKFLITVADTTPPSLACADEILIQLEEGQNSILTAILTPPPAADALGVRELFHEGPERLPAGIHSLRWIAIDTSGNRAECWQRVVVVDSEPPKMECPPDITAPTAPDGRGAADISLGQATASDNCQLDLLTNNVPESFGAGRLLLWVDPVNGDDALAKTGSRAAPFRQLSAALQKVQSGQTILCLPGTNFARSSFLTDGFAELNLRDKSNVTVAAAAPGTFVVMQTNLGNLFDLSNAPNSRITGLTLIGFRTNSQHVPYDGLRVLWALLHPLGGCDGTRIEGNRIDNAMDHAIAMLNDDPNSSTNIFVEGNHITRTGFLWHATNGWHMDRFDGTAIVPDEGWIVRSNLITDCAVGIEPFPRGGLGTMGAAVVLEGNELRNNLFGIGTSAQKTRMLIRGNVVINDTNYVWKVDGYHRPWAGPIAGQWSLGIGFESGMEGVEIRDNYVEGWTWGIGFFKGGSTNCIITGNRVVNTRLYPYAIGDLAGVRGAQQGHHIADNEADLSGHVSYFFVNLTDSTVSGNVARRCGALGGGWPQGFYFMDGRNSGIGGAVSNIIVTSNAVIGSVDYAYAITAASHSRFEDNATNLATCALAPFYLGELDDVILSTTPHSIRIPSFPNWPANLEERLRPAEAASTNSAEVSNLALAQFLMTHEVTPHFDIGTNVVRWSATDSSGNTTTCEQQVIILPLEAIPELCPENITTVAASNCAAVVNYQIPAFPPGTNGLSWCDPPSGSVFPLGTTTVNCRISDGLTKTNQCAFQIFVKETPPLVSIDHDLVRNEISITWPPTCTDWMLETIGTLDPDALWEPVTEDSILVNGENRIVMPVTGENHFFRLRHP